MDETQEKIQRAVDILNSVAIVRSRCGSCSSGQQPCQGGTVDRGSQPAHDATTSEHQPSLPG